MVWIVKSLTKEQNKVCEFLHDGRILVLTKRIKPFRRSSCQRLPPSRRTGRGGKPSLLVTTRPLAKELGLDTAYDTPQKFMSGKEVRSDDATGTDGRAIIDSAVISVSNVGSHPGKTLAGCSYSQELLEEPEAPAAPAPSPKAG